MKLNCAIVDDEPLALDLMESYVTKTPFLNLVGKYSSAVEAMKEISEKEINLIFLDIQMPEISGLEFSKIISPDTRIVFTTAFSQYAIDGYKVNAMDYLLKPISYNDFFEASSKALKWFEQKTNTSTYTKEEEDHIFIKSDYKLIRIDLKDILYIEGLKDYVKMHVEGASKPYLSLMSMKTLEERLPNNVFKRVHRSFIVNMNKITTVDRGRIVFDKNYIPVSDSYKQELADYIKERTIN